MRRLWTDRVGIFEMDLPEFDLLSQVGFLVLLRSEEMFEKTLQHAPTDLLNQKIR